MSDAICLKEVTKTFGRKVAVSGLDLTVPYGSLYGFIGPNGAGKTTTIRMVMSILFPDRGEIEVLGRRSALEAKDRIGYLPEERGVYRKMKVAPFLRYMGRLKGLDGSGLRDEVYRWLERMGLADVAAKPCEELSKGMQQKIQFIAAVLHRPDLLILDEPFSGLDPLNMRLLRNLIREEAERGTTIIFSTHVMFQAEQLCDHIVMIHDGAKVLDDSLSAIRARHDPRVLHLEPLDAEADAGPLEALAGVEEVVRADGGYFELRLAEGRDLHAAMTEATAALAPARVEIHRPSLEDVFVDIVSGTGEASGTATRELLSALREEPR